MTLFAKSGLFVAALITAANANAHRVHAEQVVVGRTVPEQQQISMDRVDHGAWTRLLSKFVDDQGQVNYREWRQSPADILALDEYLGTLSAASTSAPASRQARLAFWINAYNSVTVKGILREYPTTSIRNHTPRLVGYNIWKDLLLVVGGRKFSLDDIEHQVLRKMGEPRIHFAIVCAARSCPRLLAEAYTAAQLEQQLVANTRHFFADSENFRYDSDRRQFQMSSILKWFADDFGSDQARQLRSIAPYLPTSKAFAAANGNSVRVSYLKYDWSLNEQPVK